MKKIILLSLLVAFVTVAVADIQEPPGKRQNSIHKLSRGLANIFYGFSEIPASTVRDLDRPPSEAFSFGPVRGITRTVARFGWGIYEVITFPVANNKGSYRAPYKGTIMKPRSGYDEFPPEIGFLSNSKYTRKTLY